MRFFTSQYDNSPGNVLFIYITNDTGTRRAELLDLLREEFGPWLFLGIREHSKQSFVELYSEYLPSKVIQYLDSDIKSFTYKAEIIVGPS